MKKLGKTLFAACAALSVAGSGLAADHALIAGGAEARIPFNSSVRDFRSDSRDVIYIQDVHRQWYRGTFIAPCVELPFATAIGFNDSGIGGLDKWGTIYVRGTRCQLKSLVRSGPPPQRKHKAQPNQARPSNA